MNSKITVPSTKFHRRMNLLSLLILAGSFLLIWLCWADIPERIPMHYNFAGEVNRWGDKEEIFFLPLVGAAMYILLSVVERFPGIWNTGVSITAENKDGVYRELKNLLVSMKVGVIAVFGIIVMVECFSTGDLGYFFIVTALLLIFAPMIFFLRRIYKLR